MVEKKEEKKFKKVKLNRKGHKPMKRAAQGLKGGLALAGVAATIKKCGPNVLKVARTFIKI
jgi:hypothetical protein